MKKRFALLIFILVLGFALTACDEETKPPKDSGEEHIHTVVINSAVAPTCTATGLTEGKHCSVCGTTIVAQAVVPMIAHTEVTDAAVAPTCTTIGRTEGRRCSVCSTTIAVQETIDALFHDFVNGSCTRCGGTYSQGLDFVSNGDSTCYVSGIGTCTDTDINIPPMSPAGDTVTRIGESAFENCESILSVTIPNGVTSIGEQAFWDCDSLTSVTIPDSVTDIEWAAFMQSNRITSVTFGKNSQLKTIGVAAFSSLSKLTSIRIPNGVTSIGSSAFSTCGFESIVLPDSVTSIGSSAFYFCRELTGFIVPPNVTKIEENTFLGCYNLTSITISEGVTSIGSRTFEYCDRLVEIYNKSSLNLVKGSSGNGKIAKYALNIYTPTSGKSNIIEKDGFVFCSDGTKYCLVDYIGNQSDVVLPDTINGHSYDIYNYAFYGLDISGISIPVGVTSIGYRAFWATDLVSVTLPAGLITIGEDAFRECGKLTTVTIPASVAKIDSWSFMNCNSLSVICFEGTPAQWNAISKDKYWDQLTTNYTIEFSDGSSGETEWAKCSHCNYGYVTCSRCGGSGKQYDYWTDSNILCGGGCGGSGMVECDYCNGTGQNKE